MPSQNELLIKLVHEVREEMKDLRDEVRSAMGFINGVKWVGGMAAALISAVWAARELLPGFKP